MVATRRLKGNEVGRTRWWLALAIGILLVVVGAVALSIGDGGSPVGSGVNTAASSKTSAKTLAAEHRKAQVVKELKSILTADSSQSAIHELESAPDAPTCKAPTMPAATYPPGKPYGIPFLASITNGQLLAGYDEWTADNNTWQTSKGTLHLYPWQSKIFDISGWVTGLINLPTLSATISPQDIVFCDTGGAACLSASPPAGECIELSSQFGPEKGAKTPPPPTTDIPGGGSPCTSNPAAKPRCPCSKTPGCLPLLLSLHPSGNSNLTVTGVEPDGALEISVTTAATTTATLNTLSCTNAATQISLSTQTPSSLPPTAPVAPTPGNKDYRGLQTTPVALNGPLASATSTLVGNDFAVKAFLVNEPSSACTITLTTLLNTYAGGWGLGYGGGNGYGQGLYYQDGGTSSIVAQPGWAQFSATTTVAKLGLPVGPPSNFNF